ncbi:carbohydrate kinase, partial [Mesorhizobium sp. M7A.F.Ca.US.001.01.1.1]
MLKSAKILAVGGAHIDRRGQVSGAYVPAASNPGTMREDVGGGVFNALRSAVRRGVSASLMSVRGGDPAADTVSRAIAGAGITDLSAVFLDRTTPSYT